MKIIISDSLPSSATELLESEGWTVDSRSDRSIEQLSKDIADADALIVRSATKVTPELIAAAPKLRVVARAGTGVDNVDLDAASTRGILVLNAPGANSISVAEHACALLLASARSIALADAQMKAGEWGKDRLRGVELRGKTIGIVGLGRIGREVARRVRAFDMEVLAHDPFIATHIADDLNIELCSLQQLAERSDFITLHLPSTDATRHLIDASLLARCKPAARIINTARGDLIDEAALLEAINQGLIGGAALDVYQREPPISTALTELSSVIATPHIAATTVEAQELVGLEAATGVREYLRAGIVRNAVNYPSIEPEEFKHLRPYLVLAERMGSLLAQLADCRVTGVGIRYYGELAESNTGMLAAASLVGIFGHILSSSVSLINVTALAKQRGLEVIESRSTRARNFTSLVSLKLHTDKGERWAEGAVFEPNQPRMVRLDDVEVEVPLEGRLIVIRNDDQPGVIGEVGTILGRQGINIATFTLGRGASSAVGIVRVGDNNAQEDNDSVAIEPSVLEEIRTIAAVRSVDFVKL